jgi:hypothetical protein
MELAEDSSIALSNDCGRPAVWEIVKEAAAHELFVPRNEAKVGRRRKGIAFIDSANTEK